MSSIAELETRIRAEVAAAKAEGWRIMAMVYFVRSSMCCCPIAAVVLGGHDGMSIDELCSKALIPAAASSVLGVPEPDLLYVAMGFDRAVKYPGDNVADGMRANFVALGKRLADLADP